MRTRLQMEYIRMLNWVEVAGILDQEEEEIGLPDSQRSNRLVLIAILTEIRTLLDQFAEVNGTYFQLRPDADLSATRAVEEIELVKEFHSLSLSYEKKEQKRKHFRGTNHLIAVGRDVKAIVKNPKRLQWITVDEEKFVHLLSRLTQLNDYLHELLQEQKAREVEQITRQSYLELLQVRETVEDLMQLITALKQDNFKDISSVDRARVRNNSILKTLAEYKQINVTSEMSTEDQPPDYHSVIGQTRLRYSAVEQQLIDQKLETTSPQMNRVTGNLFNMDEKQSMWIEWKSYTEVLDRTNRVSRPLKENVMRVQELVALLQRSHPMEFTIPKCLGYFDDRDDSSMSNHDARFGLVYSKPPGCSITSLQELIIRHRDPIPSLSIRVEFAQKIATCILYLHAVNWLLKALRSDNVIFFSHNNSNNIKGGTDTSNDIDFDSLLVSGFEYARPDRDDAATRSWSSTDKWDIAWDMYRPPPYQGLGPKPVYRKTFDIYSLGILLLEIAFWKTIPQILGIANPQYAPADTIRDIRGRLLTTEPEHLNYVKANLGDKYHRAVRSCLEDVEAFGIEWQENEMSAETGARLQQGFWVEVVTPLKEIVT